MLAVHVGLVDLRRILRNVGGNLNDVARHANVDHKRWRAYAKWQKTNYGALPYPGTKEGPPYPDHPSDPGDPLSRSNWKPDEPLLLDDDGGIMLSDEECAALGESTKEDK